MKKLIAIFTVSLLLGGCAGYSLVEVKRQPIGGTYSVEPGMQWNKASVGKIDIWTINGPSLEMIRFFRGLTDGERLFTAPDDMKLPIYKAAMSASEVMEFVVDSFARGGSANVAATGLRPAQFGAVPGFRFDLSFTSSDGLWFDGMAAGAIIEGKLHLIIYTGARQHYFPKYKDEVERIFGSIQMT